MSAVPQHPPVARYRHVVEIGVGDSESTQCGALCSHADRVTLYEPNRLLWADLMRASAGIPNIECVHAAVTAHGGPQHLYHFGYASFLEGAPAFLPLAEPEGMDVAFWEPLKRTVPTMAITDVDAAGDIDYLVLTCNGGELPVLQGLKSRPRVIRTKHYMHNAAQIAEANRVFAQLGGMGYRGTVIETNQHNTFFHVGWGRIDT